ncbi:Aldose 1-epimerase [Pseudoxanthomonas suwonensis 11-1]|uniref:Aldose 1-epimerase n=1 Tax=Pseudoxanthomonas suwonensis (strain 11-1) TaxID=743721 RepID=E6WRK0_PSEUU|nr:aldose epimerase family protein [Pseudoxanthomonas suwonensis]ADV26731.1 Aldose 1-epimerase [Pseudoxanthomonas suwonensis 11-1]
MAQRRSFGRLDDGRVVHAHVLGAGGALRAEVLDLGGILARLEFAGAQGPVPLVLGLPDAASYFADPSYQGIVVGRFGNRIGGAAFTLDGQACRVSANEGRNHLHGGMLGFGRRLWQVHAHDEARLELRYHSPDGEEGYPGNLGMRAIYSIDGARLRLELEATCDAPTPFNPTHHPYWNLAGDASVPASAQWLKSPTRGFLPVDGELIPLGEVADAAGTAFDFRVARTLDAAAASGHPQLDAAGGYDHCLVLEEGATTCALLYSPHSGIALRIDCNAPALQLYDGHALDRQHPGLGRGLCLEPQGYPDAPNRPQFPQAVLRPGEVYRRVIDYRFAAPGPGREWSGVEAALAQA